MAGPGTSARAIFQAHVDGLFPESLTFDAQWTSSNAVGATTIQNLSIGDNTITVPATSLTKWILFVPPTANTAILKLKGAGGDTGWLLQSAMPTVLTYGGSTLIINASATVTNAVFTFF